MDWASEETTSTALILGASGQDGTYLSRLLAEDGFVVHGVSRTHLQTIPGSLYPSRVFWHQADLLEEDILSDVVERVRPNVVFNLTGFSHVGDSWNHQEESRLTNFVLVQNLGETLLRYRDRYGVQPFLVHTSTSEVFGRTKEEPQTEATVFSPLTPYGEHKALAHELLRENREAEGMRVGVSISYNHESPLRPARFVSRKISLAVNAISAGLQDTLVLGNLDIRRDWGYAADYAEGLLRIGKAGLSDDFILATGKSWSIKEFVEIAFAEVGLRNWEQYVEVSSEFQRKNDPAHLVGDPSHAHQALGWTAETTFQALVGLLVAADKDS